MNRARALRQLPTVHAVALRLRDRGFDADVIADALDTDDDQVLTLLRIADAKLATLMALEDGGGPDPELLGRRRDGVEGHA